MKTKLDTSRLSLRALARRKGVSPSAISACLKAGCPRNKDGTFDEAQYDGWLRRRDTKREQSLTLREKKTQAEIDRIGRDIRQRDHDYEVSRGAVHDKAACTQSLTELRAAESAKLHSMGDRLAERFPELGERLKVAVDEEVDRVIEGLRG